VVIDALDECEKEDDIRTVLQLWSDLPQLAHVPLKLFLTSRPELPIRLGFGLMSINTHQDIVLHELPRSIVQHDIFVYLQDSFSRIRKSYNLDPPSGAPLDDDWPGTKVLEELVDMAVPLFIVAATVCLFVGDSHWDPQHRLETILKSVDLSANRCLQRLQCSGESATVTRKFRRSLAHVSLSKDLPHSSDI
jgi:hypothetical protein